MGRTTATWTDDVEVLPAAQPRRGRVVPGFVLTRARIRAPPPGAARGGV